MFKFKKKENQPLPDSRKIERFCQRPYSHCRPVDYTPWPALFSDLQPKIDNWLDELFKGDINEKNANVLDSLIVDNIRAAMDNLSEQYISHTDTIHGLSNRIITDPTSFEREIEDCEVILEKLETDYADVVNRYDEKKWRESHD